MEIDFFEFTKDLTKVVNKKEREVLFINQKDVMFKATFVEKYKKHIEDCEQCYRDGGEQEYEFNQEYIDSFDFEFDDDTLDGCEFWVSDLIFKKYKNDYVLIYKMVNDFFQSGLRVQSCGFKPYCLI